MCDGDVSDLQGRYPFERMLRNASEIPSAQKSLYEVWGANHNYFNTEWQQSDARQCMGTRIFDPEKSGSKEQQTIALASVPAFFRSHLGPNTDTSFNQNFNPLVSLPSVVTEITQLDRDFTPSPGSAEAMILEDFDQDTGTNTSGNVNLSGQISIKHDLLVQDHIQRAAAISWQAGGLATFFEAVWAGSKQGRDIHDVATLDFRIARQDDALNSESTTDFSVALEDSTGRFSKPITVSDYAIINGPGTYNPVLKAVRIPLSAFIGVDLTSIHGMRFTFDKTNSGAIYLANIRLHRHEGIGVVDEPTAELIPLHAPFGKSVSAVQVSYVPANLNSIRAIRKVSYSTALAHNRPAVEIRVASQVPFPAMDRLPVLKVGDQEFRLSRYSDTRHLKELTFILTNEQYAQLVKTSAVTVHDGKIWKFDSLASIKMQE